MWNLEYYRVGNYTFFLLCSIVAETSTGCLFAGSSLGKRGIHEGEESIIPVVIKRIIISSRWTVENDESTIRASKFFASPNFVFWENFRPQVVLHTPSPRCTLWLFSYRLCAFHCGCHVSVMKLQHAFPNTHRFMVPTLHLKNLLQRHAHTLT